MLHFGNKLNKEVCHGFIFANLSNLATTFQDLVAKVKNLVTMAPVFGAISCPVEAPQ